MSPHSELCSWCVCVFLLKLLPCCDRSGRKHCPADRSGTPPGISAISRAAQD